MANMASKVEIDSNKSIVDFLLNVIKIFPLAAKRLTFANLATHYSGLCRPPEIFFQSKMQIPM